METQSTNVDPRDAEIKALKQEIKELSPHVPEATYAFNTTLVNAVSGIRGQWTIRARPGETGESFLHRVTVMVQKLNDLNWGDNIAPASQARLPASQPATSAAAPAPVAVPPVMTGGNGGGNRQIEAIECKTLVANVADGKVYWKVKGGKYDKFGVSIWDEVLQQAGFTTLDPLKSYDLTGYIATIQLKDDGKPQKIIKLYRN